MATKENFATQIDSDIKKKFRAKCKENNVDMNMLMEAFMKDYIDGKFNLIVLTKIIQNDGTEGGTLTLDKARG